MRNWDSNSYSDNENINSCTEKNEMHFKDALKIANKLQIPLHRVSFESFYWTEVFKSKFIEPLSQGSTPNPDIWCNREIKFGVLWEWALKNGPFDLLATGHYANIEEEKIGKIKDENNKDKSDIKEFSLQKATDLSKDQTYFLAQIKREMLSKITFPIGKLRKHSQVANLAIEAGLEWLVSKKESMGICFIEPRNKKSFLDEFIDPFTISPNNQNNPNHQTNKDIEGESEFDQKGRSMVREKEKENARNGLIFDYETKRELGYHHGIHHYTIGQCARLQGQQSK